MSKPSILPFDLAVAQSLGASFTTTPFDIRFHDNIGIQFNWTTSDSVGSFDVQVSNDYAKPDPTTSVTNPGTWTSLPLSTPIATASSNSNAFADINQISAAWLRIVFTRTSGTGTTNIKAMGKVI